MKNILMLLPFLIQAVTPALATQTPGPEIRYFETHGACGRKRCDYAENRPDHTKCQFKEYDHTTITLLTVTDESGVRVRVAPIVVGVKTEVPLGQDGSWRARQTFPNWRSYSDYSGQWYGDNLTMVLREEKWTKSAKTPPVEFAADTIQCGQLAGGERVLTEEELCETLPDFYTRKKLCAEEWFQRRCGSFYLIRLYCRS